jgi:hypothetical protein
MAGAQLYPLSVLQPYLAWKRMQDAEEGLMRCIMASGTAHGHDEEDFMRLSSYVRSIT